MDVLENVLSGRNSPLLDNNQQKKSPRHADKNPLNPLPQSFQVLPPKEFTQESYRRLQQSELDITAQIKREKESVERHHSIISYSPTRDKEKTAGIHTAHDSFNGVNRRGKGVMNTDIIAQMGQAMLSHNKAQPEVDAPKY